MAVNSDELARPGAAPMQAADNQSTRIDWFMFGTSVLVLVGLIAPLAIFPEQGRVHLINAFDYLTHNFGVLYIVAGVAALVFLLYLAFGPHRHVLFARDDRTQMLPTPSWAAMLFCGGIGTSVLYWGTVEWAHYYATPPFGIGPQTPEALTWAMSYPVFHWGFIGWAFYCLPGIAMGYVYYVRGASSLRLSESCLPIINPKHHVYVARVIDMIFIVGLVGAVSTGFGLAVPLIGALVADLLGLNREALGFGLDVVVIVVITLLFSASAWLGLQRGIKRLSNLNIVLAFLLLAFVLTVGPTLFIVEHSLYTAGHLLQNFLVMTTWTDPRGQGIFVESWTVFYWAWWLALGPFMGLFIAKISRGRTIQQVILGCLGYGTLGCAVFFMIMGNYAAYLELYEIVDVVGALNGAGANEAILSVLKSLPMATGVLVLFCIVCIVFAATSYDSAAYTLATAVSIDLGEEEDPGRGHRIFWAVLLGFLPITLIFMGGLRPLQAAVTLASVPLLAIMVLMSVALWRQLRDG